MPEIDSRLLLDLLLGFIALLFVPFGIRRGAALEAMVSAGILLGAAVGARWRDEAGRWLADSLGLEPATASFVVATAALLAGTFLIGYGAGIAAGNLRPGLPSRLAGGLLGALNGILFLSFLLQIVADSLDTGGALDDGIVSGVLLRQGDEVLLAGAGLVLLCIVVGWVLRATRRPPPPAPVVPARTRPVRISPAPEAGKFEPVTVPPTDPAPFPAAETAPLPEAPRGNPWQRPIGSAPPTNGHSGLPDGGPEWARRGAAPEAAAPVWTGWTSAGEAARRFANEAPAATSPAGRRCPTCGATAGATDLYCQQCGKTL